VDLLYGRLAAADGDYYLLAHLPEHDLTLRSPVRTSENPVRAKFAEDPFSSKQ
jgi:hypothetical protein